MGSQRINEWYPGPAHATVVETDPGSDLGWGELRAKYSPAPNDAFDRLVEVAKDNGVCSVLIEPRYVDPDYRSEHARFYSSTFQRYPSIGHRLHFFSEPLAADLSNLANLADARPALYRGYSVMRPVYTSPVGRTMIMPPPVEMRGALTCAATDEVHPFGQTLSVTAVPFMSQDGQFTRCAHAAQWMVLYHSHLMYRLPRRYPGDIYDASLGGLVVGRQLPSEGLSASQMLAGLDKLGLSATQIGLPKSEDADRASGVVSIRSILSRYINSNMPPIVISYDHAWVVVAYRAGDSGTTLWRHDDAMGPYIGVKNPWDEAHPAHRPWLSAIPAVPDRVYLSAERAEVLGRWWLQYAARELSREFFGSRKIRFQTYATRANRWKGTCRNRLPSSVAKLYRETHLPGFVWVVEVIDDELLKQGVGCVLGEAVIDSKAHHLARPDDTVVPTVLGYHIGGNAWVTDPDYPVSRRSVEIFQGAYASGRPAVAVCD